MSSLTSLSYADNILDIPSFRYRDNSVHLHECSPFWVGIISLLLTKKTTMFTVLCRHAHSDGQITEAFLYIIGKSVVFDSRYRHLV